MRRPTQRCLDPRPSTANPTAGAPVRKLLDMGERSLRMQQARYASLEMRQRAWVNTRLLGLQLVSQHVIAGLGADRAMTTGHQHHHLLALAIEVGHRGGLAASRDAHIP